MQRLPHLERLDPGVPEAQLPPREDRFPPRGRPRQASCRSCHKSLVFNHVGTACVDCHKDPHKGELGSRCETCHTPRTWIEPARDLQGPQPDAPAPLRDARRGALRQLPQGPAAHRVREHPGHLRGLPPPGGRAGQEPEPRPRRLQPAEVRECHSSVSRTWQQDDLQAPGLLRPEGCPRIREVPVVPRHRLQGDAAGVRGLPPRRLQQGQEPEPPGLRFPDPVLGLPSRDGLAAGDLHRPRQDAVPPRGGAPEGGLRQVPRGGQVHGTSTDCVSCHQAATTQGTTNPAHAAAGIPTTCETCHTGTPGSPPTSTTTRHGSPSPARTGRSCARGATSAASSRGPRRPAPPATARVPDRQEPEPRGEQLPDACESCHSTGAWRPASFVDHSKTRFPLTGAHQAVDCAKCHVGGQLAGHPAGLRLLPPGELPGHEEPEPRGGNFPTQCETCHTTVGLAARELRPSRQTRFPLTGAAPAGGLREVPRRRALHGHAHRLQLLPPGELRGNHEPEPQGVQLPDDVRRTCHTTAAWRPANFDHQTTRFPLTGAHGRVDCAKCHVGGRTTGTPTDCNSCHQANYAATTNPNHVASNFPTTCDELPQHGRLAARDLRPPDDAVPADRRAPAGGLREVPRGRPHHRHPDRLLLLPPGELSATTNPNHKASGFPTTCETCHTTGAWRPANFDHQTTRFPLTGAHRRVDCAKCHVGRPATPARPTDCYACHQANYEATTNPNHVAAGFPTTCESCHTTSAWRPANFDHQTTRFPLTGAHTRVDCAKCHVGGRTTGTPTDCYSCHQANYQATTNPNHVASNFPTTCATCHTTAAWRPANFDHHDDAVPADRRAPAGGLRAVPRGGPLHRDVDATATPATRRTTRQPRTRTTWRRNFPTTARPATRPRAWRPANFDHRRRGSR